MATDFGSGIHLDELFDFSVDPAGDIQADRGLNELQKDLAFQMVINLDQYRGQPPSGNLGAKVLATARRVAESDARIDSIDEEASTVSFSDDREEITLKMIVQTRDGEQELVFEV